MGMTSEPAATGRAGNGVFEAVVAIAAAATAPEAFGATATVRVDVAGVGISGAICAG